MLLGSFFYLHYFPDAGCYRASNCDAKSASITFHKWSTDTTFITSYYFFIKKRYDEIRTRTGLQRRLCLEWLVLEVLPLVRPSTMHPCRFIRIESRATVVWKRFRLTNANHLGTRHVDFRHLSISRITNQFDDIHSGQLEMKLLVWSHNVNALEWLNEDPKDTRKRYYIVR